VKSQQKSRPRNCGKAGRARKIRWSCRHCGCVGDRPSPKKGSQASALNATGGVTPKFGGKCEKQVCQRLLKWSRIKDCDLPPLSRRELRRRMTKLTTRWIQGQEDMSQPQGNRTGSVQLIDSRRAEQIQEKRESQRGRRATQKFHQNRDILSNQCNGESQ